MRAQFDSRLFLRNFGQGQQTKKQKQVRPQGPPDYGPAPHPEDLACWDRIPLLNSIEAYDILRNFLARLPEREYYHNVRYLARNDLYFLLYDILGRKDVAHPWLFARIKEVQESPNDHIDLWARDHYKSTIITFAKTIQDILASHGNDPNPEWRGREITVGIFSHTRPVAMKFLRQIKTAFEFNQMLLAFFPDVLFSNPQRQSPKWSLREGLIVKRSSDNTDKECTIEAWGLIEGQPTGAHFVIRVYDDVVVRESVTSWEMIKKTTEAWELTENMGTTGGVVRYIGTRYDEQDTYNTILESGVATPRIYPATDNGAEDGNPVFMPLADFERRKKVLSPYIFSCQMLQNPTPDNENAYFRMIEGYTLRYYQKLPPYQHLRVFATTDGAVSTEKHADSTCHILWGVDKDGIIYILDHYLAKVETDTWLKKQMEFAKMYSPIVWLGEKGGVERSVESNRKRMMRKEKNPWINYELKSCSKNKEERATNFQSLWNNGQVRLPYGAEWIEDFKYELKRFPNYVSDDQVDACSLLGLHLDMVGYGTEEKKKEEEKPPDYGMKMGGEKPKKDWRVAGIPGGGKRHPNRRDWRVAGIRRPLKDRHEAFWKNWEYKRSA